MEERRKFFTATDGDKTRLSKQVHECAIIPGVTHRKMCAVCGGYVKKLGKAPTYFGGRVGTRCTVCDVYLCTRRTAKRNKNPNSNAGMKRRKSLPDDEKANICWFIWHNAKTSRELRRIINRKKRLGQTEIKKKATEKENQRRASAGEGSSGASRAHGNQRRPLTNVTVSSQSSNNNLLALAQVAVSTASPSSRITPPNTRARAKRASAVSSNRRSKRDRNQ